MNKVNDSEKYDMLYAYLHCRKSPSSTVREYHKLYPLRYQPSVKEIKELIHNLKTYGSYDELSNQEKIKHGRSKKKDLQ